MRYALTYKIERIDGFRPISSIMTIKVNYWPVTDKLIHSSSPPMTSYSMSLIVYISLFLGVTAMGYLVTITRVIKEKGPL